MIKEIQDSSNGHAPRNKRLKYSKIHEAPAQRAEIRQKYMMDAAEYRK